ncbi:protein bunched, class 1/class 3/D/E isoforms isoform X5 [Drosophila obscura]|uniref:protein bunched, class 1/class 3/D/E isoforms isoform X5 n=1 Tax=Drosophila obscura TaxID=7282 RepID=UPI000BA10923|nr:protein bunched, class 1/class 3/D/E isoforms isoform X5 [Drosophila obscura]
MMGTMSLRQPENWLYEIWQQGYDSPCYVMVPNAKDLVKSHLMIAVREEVEVLKERISELMDKINKLELENNILKSNIPQETLQQLQMQLQIAGTQQPAAVGAPPATPAIQAPPVATAAVAVAAVAAGAGQVAVATVGAATSPATAAAPTTIPNGSAENGSVIVDAVAAVEQQAQSAAAAAAAAASVQTATPVNTNGPMS